MANHEQDMLWVQNPTKEDFTVIWGKQPYTIVAGGKKVYPRFIAEHFAKHLADKILLQQEAAEKQKSGKQVSYLNSKQHRPPVVNSILTGVYQYFIQNNEDPSTAAARQAEQINEQLAADGDKALDLGDIDADKAMGNLEDFEEDTTIPPQPSTIENQPPVGHTLEEAVTAPNAINQGQASPDDDVLQQNTQQPPETTTTTPPETPGGNRSINELRTEAKRLGLKITGRESKDVLLSMIQNF